MSEKRRNPVIWVLCALTTVALGIFISPPLQGFRESLVQSAEDEELVTKIALEQPLATVRDLFGPSSYEHELLDMGKAIYKEIGWARNGWLVTGIFGARDQLVAFSVVSCDPGFTPTFTPIRNTSVSLQTNALDAIEPDSAPTLFYSHQSPPSTVDLLVEEHVGYTVGISSVCGDTDFAGTGDESSQFFGSAVDAPNKITEFRSETEPNFYAERSVYVSRDSRGSFTIDLGDDGIIEHLQTLDTPSLTQVPKAIVAELQR